MIKRLTKKQNFNINYYTYIIFSTLCLGISYFIESEILPKIILGLIVIIGISFIFEFLVGKSKFYLVTGTYNKYTITVYFQSNFVFHNFDSMIFYNMDKDGIEKSIRKGKDINGLIPISYKEISINDVRKNYYK